jgi:hypothetical protein
MQLTAPFMTFFTAVLAGVTAAQARVVKACRSQFILIRASFH